MRPAAPGLAAAAAALAFAGLARAQSPAGSPAPGQPTTVAPLTVPRLPLQTCKPTDEACYRTVTEQLKAQFPKQYYQLAVKCMHDEANEAAYRMSPFVDDTGQSGQVEQMKDGEKTFCRIAQADAPEVKKRLDAAKLR
jgi:hypothetical protein